MIQFDNVSKRYPGGYEALIGINLRIERGELVVLRGHSGAGKSTLLKLLPVLERPTSGRVLINAQDVSRLPAGAIPYLRRSLGLVTQDSRLLYDRNVLDNVMLPLILADMPARDAKARVRAALERVGLAQHERSMPISLSGGEQQRVAIARAIVNRPTMLIADEPTANLDAAYAQDIAALFRDYNEAGVTMIIATHDERLFADRAPRRIELSKGRLVSA